MKPRHGVNAIFLKWVLRCFPTTKSQEKTFACSDRVKVVKLRKYGALHVQTAFRVKPELHVPARLKMLQFDSLAHEQCMLKKSSRYNLIFYIFFEI